MSIRVLIADDQAVFRRGMRALLEDEPDLEVVGEAADGAEVVALAHRRAADVVLMDIRMPRMDGLSATRMLTTPDSGAAVDVLVLTTFDLDEYVFGALEAGAAGFLLKDSDPETVFRAIRTVAHGGGLIAPEVTRRVIARFASMSPRGDRRELFDALSPREQDVLRLMAQGLSNAEIGSELVLEEATVKSHVSRLLAKLGLRSRVQAVILAYEAGIVTPGSSRGINAGDRSAPDGVDTGVGGPHRG